MTGIPDAPPARGVPERDVWPPAELHAGVAALNADLAAVQSTFRAWTSDARRVWVTRATGGLGAVAGKPHLATGCGEALDADNPAAMRDQLEALGVLEPGPEWFTTAEVAVLFGASASSVTDWARKGKFGKFGVVRMGRCMRYRASAVRALREQAEMAAA